MNDEVKDDGLSTADIATLRRVAKLLGVKAAPNWDKQTFIEEINKKGSGLEIPTDPNGPKPGYARIIIHRDPTPGHKNTPIHAGVNGMVLQIPRGIEVDVQIPFVEALKNSVQMVPELVEEGNARNPSGSYKDVPKMSYPFQVLAITPGENFRNPHDNRVVSYERRKAFESQFGRWPTRGELEEAMKAKIIKDIHG